MENEILRLFVNRYSIEIKNKNGIDFLYTSQKVDTDTMDILKKYKPQIIDIIKKVDEVEETKNRVTFLASFLDALEKEKLKDCKNTPESILNGGSEKCVKIANLIKEHKELYPEDSVKAEAYKYIFDKACKVAKHYGDLYFATIGDKYINKVIGAPVNAIELIKDEFETEIESYHLFKHNDYPDV